MGRGTETLSRKLKMCDEKEIGFHLGSVLRLFRWTFKVWMQELDISSRSLVSIWLDCNNIHLCYEFMPYILHPSSADGWMSGYFWGIWNNFSCFFKLQTSSSTGLWCGHFLLSSHPFFPESDSYWYHSVCGDFVTTTCKSLLVISSASGKDKRERFLLLYFIPHTTEKFMFRNFSMAILIAWVEWERALLDCNTCSAKKSLENRSLNSVTILIGKSKQKACEGQENQESHLFSWLSSLLWLYNITHQVVLFHNPQVVGNAIMACRKMCRKHQAQMVLRYHQNSLKPKPYFIVPIDTEVT